MKDNPDILFDLVEQLVGVAANENMLKLFNVDTVQEYLTLDSNAEHWRENTGWKEFYGPQLAALAAGKPHFGDDQDLAKDRTEIIYSSASWVPFDYAHDWSVVITTHEDISERKTLT